VETWGLGGVNNETTPGQMAAVWLVTPSKIIQSMARHTLAILDTALIYDTVPHSTRLIARLVTPRLYGLA